MDKKRILIVDDEQSIQEYLSKILSHEGYETKTADNAQDALEIIKGGQIDLLLTDIKMPGKSGLWLLEQLKKLSVSTSAMVITASDDLEDAVEAFEFGAENYMLKPLHMDVIFHKVRIVLEKRRLFLANINYQHNLERLVAERTGELNRAKDRIRKGYIETIQRLTIVAEYKDEETGSHLSRIGLYVKILAEVMGLSADKAEILHIASAMHDIGKISIPDNILSKPGPLTLEEFEIVKKHTVVGAKILKGSDSEFLKVAEGIALGHHEKWDGTGYPYGLKKEEIPVENRIMSIADQYDALRSRRPYKPPFDHQTAYKIITEGDRKSQPEQFDPAILELFKKHHKNFDEIYESVK